MTSVILILVVATDVNVLTKEEILSVGLTDISHEFNLVTSYK